MSNVWFGEFIACANKIAARMFVLFSDVASIRFGLQPHSSSDLSDLIGLFFKDFEMCLCVRMACWQHQRGSRSFEF